MATEEKKETREDKDTFASLLTSVKANWVFVILLVTLISGWGSIHNRVAQNEDEIARLQAKIEITFSAISEVRTDIAEIKTSLDFIKEQLSKK